MNFKRITLAGLLSIGFGLATLHAQESVNAAGGNASGTGGQVSFSVGQVNYTTQTSLNGSVSQGVQQIFQISVINGFEDADGINAGYAVYPNPSNEILTVSVDASKHPNLQSMKFQLFDSNGRLLDTKKPAGNETGIDVSNLLPAMYYLKIMNDNTEVKIFKIIKNQVK